MCAPGGCIERAVLVVHGYSWRLRMWILSATVLAPTRTTEAWSPCCDTGEGKTGQQHREGAEMSRQMSSTSVSDNVDRQEVLDFLVTEEQLGVTFLTAAIGNAPGTPSEAFVPV